MREKGLSGMIGLIEWFGERSVVTAFARGIAIALVQLVLQVLELVGGDFIHFALHALNVLARLATR
jgi:hypothetical protein